MMHRVMMQQKAQKKFHGSKINLLRMKYELRGQCGKVIIDSNKWKEYNCIEMVKNKSPIVR